MKILFPSLSRFLVTPPIHAEESLRGYISRIARYNKCENIMQPLFSSLSTITAAIPELSKLTGVSADILNARGGSILDKNSKICEVNFGSSKIPKNQIFLQQRQVCPLCLIVNGISKIYWELSIYSVCHKHGILMLNKCTKCGRVLTWSSNNRCLCGLDYTKFKIIMKRKNKSKLFSLIVHSVKKSIYKKNRIDTEKMIPIDWFLLLIEFINYVLIPGFWREFRTDAIDINEVSHHILITSILNDKSYRDYLRDIIFIKATEDPMTLIQSLKPGNKPQTIRLFFEDCINDIPFHRSIWAFHRSHPSNRRLPSIPKINSIFIVNLISEKLNNGELFIK